MQPPITTTLSRDCDAVAIPQGTSVVLPQGTTVDITQSLGGSFTVRLPQGLFRIGSADADALGQDADAAKRQAGSPTPEGPVQETQVWDVLRTCFDPEIPVNIVDLGLIYDLRLQPGEGGRCRVDVKMTLTAPGCGMGGVIAKDAQEKILLLDGVEEATVEVVWDPPWHQSMITPEGRRALGL